MLLLKMLKGRTAPQARVKPQHSNRCHLGAVTHHNAEATANMQEPSKVWKMKHRTTIEAEKSLEIEMSTYSS